MPSERTRNQAAVLFEPGVVRLEDVAVPVPGEREVLVEVRSVGVCGSDVRLGIARTADLRDRAPADLGAFDALVECSGAPGVAASGLAALRPAGRAILVGMSSRDDLVLPLSLVQTRELTVTGSFRYANTYPAAVALAVSGAVPLTEIVDAAFPLDQVPAALQAAHDPSFIKVIVHPNEEVRP